MINPLRVAINGYGRIGRSVLRSLFEAGLQQELQLIAINELADARTIGHLTKYDSTHGRFRGRVDVVGEQLIIDGAPVQLLHETRVDRLPWQDLGIDLLLECSGSFSDRETAEQHLRQGARHLLFSQPAEADVDATVIFGFNHHLLNAENRIVSNASCTTNCCVPVLKALDDAFGVDSVVITTLHSAMNDQPVIDAYHHTDLRKTRSAINSMIPVDTGLARGIERFLPELKNRVEAQAMRIPIANVSAIDLSVVVKKDVGTVEVNRALANAAECQFDGVLGYTEELLASCDFNHDRHSGVIDAGQTRVAGGRLVKVLTWFDNEWGFANRMLDVALAWRRLMIPNSLPPKGRK